MKKICKMSVIGLVGIILFILIIFMAILGGSQNDTTNKADTNLSASVEAYRPIVTKIAKQEGMEDYVQLVLAVMEVESHGNGNDPMQASEGSYNKKFPNVPNGITDPYYSIECGIKQLKNCLDRAGIKEPNDYERIKVALGGYNFGNGFIEWIDANHGGKWSLAAATEFSVMMANRLGWKGYGDPPYANKVMNYYMYTSFITGDGDFIAPERNYVTTSGYGMRSLGDFHFGQDIDGGFGTGIFSPSDAEVYKASNTCPATGGFFGNMCPAGSAYSGGGNFVQLRVKVDNKTLYIFICHMKTVTVKEGQTVKKGQKIGEQGHSGNSTGSHAHIEIHENTPSVGVQKGAVDPRNYIEFK